jgi:hypothetical protein
MNAVRHESPEAVQQRGLYLVRSPGPEIAWLASASGEAFTGDPKSATPMVLADAILTADVMTIRQKRPWRIEPALTNTEGMTYG